MRKLAGLVSLALGFEPGAAGAMVELSRVEFYAGVRDVEIVGDLAYTTSGEGLHVIDVSDPAHPVVLGGSTSRSRKVSASARGARWLAHSGGS